MTLGIVMLCHAALDRAAQLARHWNRAGCPVMIHIDRRAPAAEVQAMRAALADLPQVGFSPRHACEWGTWSMVAATQTAAERLLAGHPQVRHVYLASGTCLPLRPVAELLAWLDAHPQTDFIESVTTADVGWTVGGLDIERFTLRFPFSWKRHRRAFDRYVAIQRALGLRRAIPAGIVPHLGSQWWCLTRRTLGAILDAPDRPAMDRYFRRVWIPDESYFQTQARRWSADLESRSLTLSKFDDQGRPFTFYDDHIELLHRSDCFVARKAWPGAGRLWDAFLSDRPAAAEPPRPNPNPALIDRVFSRAVERRRQGRAGLVMQTRFPRADAAAAPTSAPYSVFHGLTDLFQDFEAWLSRCTGARVHGHLFAPDRVHFAGEAPVFHGALGDSAALRDHNPAAFLTSLIWNARGDHQIFQFSPRDAQPVVSLLARDPNARITAVTGTWALALHRSGGDFAALRAEAARLQRIEADFLARLRDPRARARIRVWTMGEFLENPVEPLQAVIEDIAPGARRLAEAPRLQPMDGFPRFLQNLRNQGMQPVLVGELPQHDRPGGAARPYLVR